MRSLRHRQMQEVLPLWLPDTVTFEGGRPVDWFKVRPPHLPRRLQLLSPLLLFW